MRRSVSFGALVALVGGVGVWTASTVGASAAPAPTVIDHLVTSAEADAAQGWAVDPTNPGGGGQERLVEGPATPPSGRGSIELTTPTTADRAQVYTIPVATAGPVPAPSPWSSLTGASYATFTFSTSNPSASLPVLRFGGYQSFAGGVPSGFTTLSFGEPGNGVAVPGQWQTWTLTADTQVFQSNATDSFCLIAAPCTFSDFVSHYPDGVWAQVAVGVGSGAPAGSVGYADAVSLTHGTGDAAQSFLYDFEVPAPQNSTASVAAGPATSTGGQANVTLIASSVAAGPVTFTITSALPDGSTRTTDVVVQPGQTTQVPVDVPFGTTTVSVSAQGVSIASGTVSFAAPAPPGGQGGGGQEAELAESGSSLPSLAVPFGFVGAGLAFVAAGALRSRRRSRGRDGRLARP